EGARLDGVVARIAAGFERAADLLQRPLEVAPAVALDQLQSLRRASAPSAYRHGPLLEIRQFGKEPADHTAWPRPGNPRAIGYHRAVDGQSLTTRLREAAAKTKLSGSGYWNTYKQRCRVRPASAGAPNRAA